MVWSRPSAKLRKLRKLRESRKIVNLAKEFNPGHKCFSRRLYTFFAIPPDSPPHFAPPSYLVGHLGSIYWKYIVGIFFFLFSFTQTSVGKGLD